MVANRFKLVLFYFLLHYRVETQQEVLIEESSTVESVQAPTGGRVELPCDVRPALTGDRVGLVIWYKQGHETPIYTVDAREAIASQWSDPSTLGTRASFRFHSVPAVLVLTKLRPEDSGQYRCRVDFIKSPTKNTRLNLTVLIPPERLIVINQDGGEVQGGILGPYNEGSNVNLTCVAVGGRPAPRVSWWKSHALLANSEARATVSFRPHRADFGTDITCQAVTDPSMTPLSKTLTIDVNLRPLWARIQGEKRPLVAGQSTELTCQVLGARPKPTITWWKGGKKLNTVREVASVDGNITNSILTFVPAIEDAGRVLLCRAVQPKLPHSTREDGWNLEIQYVPDATLQLGSNLDPDNLVEGSDVYLDCRIRANPWHTNVYFTHNGATVRSGPGVILANQSLVLQHVSRQAAGAYVCSARNSLGDGRSKPLMLDIKYVPTCKSPQPTAVRAARGEAVEIECELDANPTDPITYHWWFNSSTHTKRQLKVPATEDGRKPGTLLYMVNTSAEYGWVQCFGVNSVGAQAKPCLFQISPAEKPSAVKSCEVTNVTYDSLTVNCTPGYDGGVRQTFILEVFDKASGVLLYNTSSREPQFEVWGLSTANILSVSVRAYNTKGSSEALTIVSSLLKYPERRTAQVPVKVELTTLLITVLAAVGLIVVTIAVFATVCYCKYCNKRQDINEKGKRPQDETSDVLLTEAKKAESADSLDKNPDIIPINTKIHDGCSNKLNTDYSSIRRLISRNNLDNYDIPTSLNTFYNYNVDTCQYNPCGRLDCRVPNIQPGLAAMPNIGANAYRQPYDTVYEDWLRYKHALPLDTSDLLPLEQLRPPEKCTLPPPAVYSDGVDVGVPQIQPDRCLYRVEPSPSLSHKLSLSAYAPVCVNADGNTAYYNRKLLPHTTNSLPRLSGKNATLPKQRSVDARTDASTSADTRSKHQVTNHEQPI